ncbi:DNA polymerase III subunit delta [Candidatus Falkowbacteria bacterium RIFOXYD2_FULL_35_9]|uniref:DNA polymerase III subunit delta n=1 Tax=Candidatus Falkowbacteria bacterium RIFOXYC2_FULL_36_12 TaxID=1798002 RepID=A0A1F5T3H7_9BACT|nr:MAG: DNA polymerase III subunit delta [Candidatus Falkowbacteria bacterium RIFOXYB2_FULL_35_7]OGF33507.1 MAG: DNA polymerase III subunit delta [Candidatus Falkowbacteria bacterium RIFOXYC2_FULL_36_12]OGF47774.1 MAG: DNA polymerase III subunit delta [Candidatus Falkowbacteria bacterium RIFOXYD2_FULL_35_9]
MEKKKQIFLWYGQNNFDLQQTMQQWMSLFEKKYSGFNIVRLDVDEKQVKGKFVTDLKTALQVDSLFGANKLIIVKNLLIPANLKEEVEELLFSSLEKISDSFFLIFVQDKKPDARSKVFKFLKSLEKTNLVEIKEFLAPRPFELNNWILKRVEYYKGKIENKAVEMMSALVGPDLWLLDSEIQKLIAYAEDGMISADDVKKMVKGKYNEDIFQLMDAISQKNKVKAWKLIRDQLDSGANEIYLFTMLVRQFRLLRQIKIFVTEKKVSDSQIIARELKIHPFVVQKILGQVSSFSLDQLKEIYRQLLEFEIGLKNKNFKFNLLFDKFITQL